VEVNEKQEGVCDSTTTNSKLILGNLE